MKAVHVDFLSDRCLRHGAPQSRSSRNGAGFIGNVGPKTRFGVA
jgi:hypothetical protein